MAESELHEPSNQQETAKKHECLYCFRVYASLYRLKRHSLVHSSEKIFHCQFCESSFRLHTELLQHENTHSRTIADTRLKRCKTCGIACHKDKLLEHFREHHEHFECDLCNKVYRTKNHLKVHMTSHINAREYRCSICPKAFNFCSQLKRHEASHSTTAVWYCEVCGVGFKNKHNLAHHMRRHNGLKPFQCDRCDRSFSAKQSLELHIRIHEGKKPYKCPWEQCGRRFNDMTTMKVHTRLHTNENPYICHLCGKSTKQASNLKSHYLHAHKIKDITSKTIRSNARLLEQYKKENLSKTGMLQILNEQFQRNIMTSGKEHVVGKLDNIQTTKRTVNCKMGNAEMKKANEGISQNVLGDVPTTSNGIIAGSAIKQETTVPNNITTVTEKGVNYLIRKEIVDIKPLIKVEPYDNTIDDGKSFKNSDCKTICNGTTAMPHKVISIEQVFVREELNYAEVFVKQENDLDRNINVPMNFKVENNSSFCDIGKSEVIVNQPKIQSQKRSYKNSLSSSATSSDYVAVSKIKLQKRAKNTLPKIYERNFTCNICARVFRLELKLIEHMKLHTKAADKVKICEICGKTFSLNSALQKHLTFTHSNFRPFPCKLCDRAFKDSTGLKVHLRSHSGEKPYPCSFCPKSFSTAMGKNLHERGHTGEKPYKCKYCDSSFSDNSTYKQHVRIHTGEKPYICHLCGQGTAQAGNLKSHLRHAHKLQIKNVSMKRN